MDCIFCDIIHNRAEAEILYQDEQIISFLDINPLNYGHALVVPRDHKSDFLELPPVLSARLMEVLQLVSESVTKALQPDGFNIIANNGKAAGQVIFHCHFHIIPRFINDDVRFIPVKKNYTGDLMKQTADRIRETLSKRKA
jgi:histidine triad (HIT) family protein